MKMFLGFIRKIKLIVNLLPRNCRFLHLDYFLKLFDEYIKFSNIIFNI